MKTFSLLFILIIISKLTFAQGIKGTIVDKNNEAIAYANIYVPALKTGTTSNLDGNFELKLPPGEWEVLFQYIGYKSHREKFKIDSTFIETRIVFVPQNIRIKEIKVLASGEDPAYYVMRRAIAMAPYYTNQVLEYDCKLYLKGSGVVHKIPKVFKKQFEKEGVEKDKPFVMESINKIHFELPDKLDQEVIAMHVSGAENNTSPLEMITTNLYNVSDYGIVSPVGRFALKKYNFELMGVFEDQGKLINKIKVSPKVKGKGTFEGFINIVEDYWNIHSADLEFSMPFMDVQMRQIYAMVDDNTWMPTSLDFEMDISVLGIGMKYNYVASFSDYSLSLNDQLDHTFLDEINQKVTADKHVLDSIYQKEEKTTVQQIEPTKEQEKINALMQKEDLSNREMYKLEKLLDKEVKRTMPPEPLEIKERVKVKGDVTKNDSLYWAELRPIPLTQKENSSFGEKDSIMQVQSTPEYKDSIRNSMRKFKFKDVIMGRTYRYEEDSARFSSSLSVPGLISISEIEFNTVDGFKLSFPFNYSLRDTLGKRLYASTELSYAFSRQAVNANGSVYYLFNGVKRSWIRASGGKVTADFKNKYALKPMETSFYTLELEDNFQKFYEKKYVSISGGTEIFNGFQAIIGFDYTNRSPLENHSGFKMINRKNKEYTENIPEIDGLENWQLGASTSSIAHVGFTYKHKQRYRIRNNIKYPASCKFPTIGMNYKTTIGGDASYGLLEMNLTQNLRIGFSSTLEYKLEAGKFLNNDVLFAQDFRYFNANDRLFAFANESNKFQLLDYYEATSKDYFLEGHLIGNFEKILLKRLPILNRTLIRENLFVNYLHTENMKHYAELGYGLRGIFLMIDVDFVVGFEDMKHTRTGIKISLNLN